VRGAFSARSSATWRGRSTPRSASSCSVFLALFAFFDLIKELADLGSGEYHLPQVFTFVLLSVPAHAYELFPVVVLIGTLYVLAHLASNSEYTVMRGSGFSPARARAGAYPHRPGLCPGDLRHRRMDRSVRRGGSAKNCAGAP